MSNHLTSWVTQWALPVIGVLFVVLYIMHLAAGAEAESALAQAGGAGLLLALLGRLTIWVLETADQPGQTEDPEDLTLGAPLGMAHGLLARTDDEPAVDAR